MTALTLLFLTLSLNLSDQPRSELVPASHSHQWIEIERTKDTAIFLDQAETPSYLDDAGSYQTVLVRGVERYRNDSLYSLDAITAIDCEKSMFAVTALWEQQVENQKFKRPLPKIGEFVQANDRADEKALTAMFQHVCGPEWKFEVG